MRPSAKSVSGGGLEAASSLTCHCGIKVFELQDLVGALAACHAALVDFKIVADGFLHVPGAAAEVSAVVKRHALQENTLGKKKRGSVSAVLAAGRWRRRGERTHFVRLLLVVDEVLVRFQQSFVVVHVLGELVITRVLLQEGVGRGHRFLQVVELLKSISFIFEDVFK